MNTPILDKEEEKLFDKLFVDGLFEEEYNQNWPKSVEDKYVWVNKIKEIKQFIAASNERAVKKERDIFISELNRIYFVVEGDDSRNLVLDLITCLEESNA